MGILDRLQFLVRSELSSKSSEASPDIQRSLLKAREQLASLSEDERRLEQQLELERREEAACEERAIAALRVADEAAAKAALQQRNRYAARSRVSLDALHTTRAQCADLSAAIAAVSTRLEAAQLRARSVASAARERSQHAKGDAGSAENSKPGGKESLWGKPQGGAPETARDSLPPPPQRHTGEWAPARERASDGPFVSPEFASSEPVLARMEAQLERMEAELEVEETLSSADDELLREPRESELERRFRELERKQPR